MSHPPKRSPLFLALMLTPEADRHTLDRERIHAMQRDWEAERAQRDDNREDDQ